MRAALGVVLSVWLLGLAPAAVERPLAIGSRKQLFLDRRLIADARGVELSFNPPQHFPSNLLPAERPWERGRLGAYASVLEDDGRYRMYYNSFDARYESEYLCVALSDDGVRWTRPRVGTIEHEGARDNNIVGVGVRGRVFIDPFDAPARRYKLLTRIDAEDPRWPLTKGSRRLDATYLLTSADGFSWERVEEPVLQFHTAAVSDVFFDDLAGRWAVYMRGSLPDTGSAAYARIEVPRDGLARPFPVLPGTRAAERGRAVDLRGEAPFVFQTDANDSVGAHVYTLYAHRYGWADAAYVAFPSIWYSRRPSLGGLSDPTASDGMEMQFAFSHDGIAWRRPFRRSIVPAWLEAGPNGVDQVYCGGMVRHRDEVVVYYSRVAGRHLLDDWKPLGRLASIGRVVFRLDGFVSADATEAGGELTTPVLDFEGRRLELNAWTGAGGWIEVALLDEKRQPLPEFGPRQAIRLAGNSVRHVAAWKRGSDVGALAGRPVRVRIALRDAKLFALQFVP